MQLDDEEPQAYAALAALLGGDGYRVRLILGVFHQSARKDLQWMERAAIEGNWSQVRRLAQRMAIGCRQIGEERMADMLVAEVTVAIDRARCGVAADPDTFGRSFANARRELVDVLDRAAAYASTIVLESVA